MSNINLNSNESLDSNMCAEILKQADENDGPNEEQNSDDSESVDEMILSSISKDVNTMAKNIHAIEGQKQMARNDYINFFKRILIFLIIIATILIVSDTFLGITVRIEFLVSVLVVIIADVFAIVHTLVKYTTSVEHYEVYNKLIDSLLKCINHNNFDKL